MKTKFNRRQLLRGMVNGVPVAVALPFLDCFLNDSGTALAATGAALPSVFGTYFQHLGLNPGLWEPKTVGPGYENNVQLKALNPYRSRMNIFSGMRCFLDGRPLEAHVSSVYLASTGSVPDDNLRTGPSLDYNIANAIGKRTRFRSLEAGLSGQAYSFSQRSGTAVNSSEISPVAMYTRVFGPGYVDPNGANFTPDPTLMVRRSVLSHVSEDRQDLMRKLGSADRARIDEYFTAIRELEAQLELAMQKPAPLEACSAPKGAPEQAQPGSTTDIVEKNANLFFRLLAQALACDQTRVVNVMLLGQSASNLRKAGETKSWHTATHEEAVDEKLGYQKGVMEFTMWALDVFVDFLKTMESIREGDGTLLDRMLVLWQTEHSVARTHSIENMPILTIGNGGGRIKTGIHLNAAGDSITRVGLTIQQAMGVPLASWGDRSNETKRTFTEIMA